MSVPLKYPRMSVDLDAIRANARAMCAFCGQFGIRVAGVVKFSDGSIPVARAYAEGGCAQIAVSRAVHLRRIKHAMPTVETMLTRIPMLSEMATVARYCDLTLMSEEDSLRGLEQAAAKCGTRPGVLLMLDVGDLREGVTEIDELCRLAVLCERELPHVRLRGIGAGFACLNGVLPTPKNLARLVEAVHAVEAAVGHSLEIVSGGSSVDLIPLTSGQPLPPEINHLRIGGSIANPYAIRINRGVVVPGTREDTITISAEIIEVQTKPSFPPDGPGKNWSGSAVQVEDKGLRRRAIAAIGSQDIGDARMLIPLTEGVTVVGCSSDHTVLDVTDAPEDWRVGSVMSFRALYMPLLYAFSTRHLHIHYQDSEE